MPCKRKRKEDNDTSEVTYFRRDDVMDQLFKTISGCCNGWMAKEKAVALPPEGKENYSLLRRLEMRYGHAHLEQMYQSQMKNRRQKTLASLQEFEVDVVCFAWLLYSVDDVRDDETRRALRLARPMTLTDAPFTATKFEAAKEVCKGCAKIRIIVEEDQNEGISWSIWLTK